jgi:hypothetical protein
MSRKRIKRKEPLGMGTVAKAKRPAVREPASHPLRGKSEAVKRTANTSATRNPATSNSAKRLSARVRMVAAFALITVLITATAILAQRGKQRVSAEQKQSEQGNNSSQSTGELSPETLTSPSIWSKEYIHGPGGRIVATEERLKFIDVADGSQFWEDIYRIAARGVTVGCPAPNYCPEGAVTRAQMAVFIERALGVFTPPTPTTQHFTDVPPGYWAYAFIEDFATRGITSGCTPTTYCPEGTVTHEQMAKFTIVARGEPNPPTPPAQRFNDVLPSNVFYNFIERMGALDIWQGQGCPQGPGYYCPGAPVTRRQMAHILVKAFGI